MKKVLFTIATAVMMFAATSCKKESINEPATDVMRDPAANEFLASIDGGGMVQNAPRVNDGMNTMATFKDKLKVMWQQGDVIYVNGTENAFTCNSDPTTDNRAYFENKTKFPNGYHADEYHAFYSTSVTPSSVEGHYAEGSLNNTQYVNPAKLAENLPMYATSEDHWLNFSNVCAAVKFYVACQADEIVITSNEVMNGDFTITGGVMTMIRTSAEDLSDEEKTITLKSAATDQKFHQGDSVYVAIPAGTYTGLKITIKNGGAVQYETATATGSLIVEANHIYKLNNLMKGQKLLPSPFTVAEGKQVRFTTGNLWCNRNDNKSLHLEATQKDTAFSNSDEGHVGHFYFSKTIDNASKSSMSSTESNPYLFCDESHGKVQADGITNLYCISPDEWGYIIENNKYSYRTVDNQEFLIIASSDYDVNNTIPQLASIKDYTDAGFLCLPKVRIYNKNNKNNSSNKPKQATDSGGRDMENCNTGLYYWSSTISGNYGRAINYYGSLSIKYPISTTRIPIRLVQNVATTPAN